MLYYIFSNFSIFFLIHLFMACLIVQTMPKVIFSYPIGKF